MSDDIPKPLIREVREGRAVLFLGAGACYGAKRENDDDLPLGDGLRDLLVDRFLEPHNKSKPLAFVSELAIDATDLSTVQDFVADRFHGLIPADYHYLIPSFSWRGIATTNYDRLIEHVYESDDSSVQDVVPFVHDDDRVDEKVRRGGVALVKLHGCVTRTHDPDLPLILSIDQYITHRKNRKRLFNLLADWGSECSIVFAGHSVEDIDIRTILLELERDLGSRPQYYIVRPGITAEEQIYWARRGTTTLSMTFESFLRELDDKIEKTFRVVQAQFDPSHPIKRKFATHSNPSQSLLETLSDDLDYVHEGLTVPQGSPPQFYRGFDLGWYPIITNLDVRRSLVDRFIEDVVLKLENDRNGFVELFLIKAEAGAGKSVLMRRIAWEAATKVGSLCLWSNASSLEFGPLRELAEKTHERIFLFVDDAANALPQIRGLIELARKQEIALTIVTAERINVWNTSCSDLEELLTSSFRLNYLSEREIQSLVECLERHDCSGPNLAKLTRAQRAEEFRKRMGRQLLVALHEATQGIPFEEILLDEYRHLASEEAQRLYLSVCVLNRFRVPVRAGIINRAHDIPFAEFRDRLFSPLEHVVLVSQQPWGDHCYESRHPEIAQIVFEQVLTNTADRYDEIVRLLRVLNPMYSTDEEAIKGLVRAKSVHELFPNAEDGLALYKVADEVLGESPHLLQQRANYERVRPNGNLQLALSHLKRASELDRRNPTIPHTTAEVIKALADRSSEPLERRRLRNEARAELARAPKSRYTAVTILKLQTDDIRDLLDDAEVSERRVSDTLRNADRDFQAARQEYPGDAYISSAESDFANLLNDNKRSLDALERARKANPRDAFVASRLAQILAAQGDQGRAKTYLEEALESNRGDKRLNFQYAELLRESNEASIDDLIYLYQRAFTRGDSNHESQFWYARFAWQSDDLTVHERACEIFAQLDRVKLSFDDKTRVRDSIRLNGKPVDFYATTQRVEAAHGFLDLDRTGQDLFFHHSAVQNGDWDDLRRGVRLLCNVGFTIRGPIALRIRVVR